MTEGDVMICERNGQHLSDFAPKPIGKANESGNTITAKFNGIAIPVNPGDTVPAVVDRYLNLFLLQES